MVYYYLFIIPLIILGIVASLVLLILNFQTSLRGVATVLKDNLSGDGPMTRPLPNLAFLGLFLLLIKVTWF